MEKKNRNGRKVMAVMLAGSLAAGILGGCGQTAADTADAKEVEITNVSYDPTRELYEAYNALFAEHWKEHLGEYEIVVSSVSILCQPTVALVDEVVDDRGTGIHRISCSICILKRHREAGAGELLPVDWIRRSMPRLCKATGHYHHRTSGRRKWIVDDIALTDIARPQPGPLRRRRNSRTAGV